MKFTYMLQNQNGVGRRVPYREVWQWIYDIEDSEKLKPVLNWVDHIVSIEQLDVINMYWNHEKITSAQHRAINFACKQQVIYVTFLNPDRVLTMGQCGTQLKQPHTQTFRPFLTHPSN